MRTLTADTLIRIGTIEAEEGLVILEIQWVDGNVYYADKDITIDSVTASAKILEMDDVVFNLRFDNKGETASVSFTVDDTDSTIKTRMNTEIIEGTSCNVYYIFQGQTWADKINIFPDCKISGPIEWTDAGRSLSFSLESKQTKTEAGYELTELDLPDESSAIGSIIPKCFGSVRKVPGLRLDDIFAVTLASNLSIYTLGNNRQYVDINDPFNVLTHGQSGFFEIGPEKQRVRIRATVEKIGPAGQPVNRLIFTGQVVESLTGVTGTYINRWHNFNLSLFGSTKIGISARVVGDPDENNHRVAWLASNVNIINMWVIVAAQGSGNWYVNRCSTQQGTKCRFQDDWFLIRQGDSGDGKQLYARYNLQLDSNYFILEACYYPSGRWVEHTIATRVEGGTVSIPNPAAVTTAELRLGESLSQPTFIAGSDVRLNKSTVTTFIINEFPDTQVTSVHYKRSIPNQSGQFLAFLPEQDNYRVINYTLESGKRVSAILVIAQVTGSAVLEDWTGEIFVDLVSNTIVADSSGNNYQINSNIADQIKYLLGAHSNISIDSSSFAEVRGLVNKRPANWVLQQRTDVLQLVSDIAWQANCLFFVRNNVAYLKYLPVKPLSGFPITEDIILEKSLSLSYTDTSDIITKFIVTYRDNYSDEEDAEIELIYNGSMQDRLGIIEEEYDIFIYNEKKYIDQSMGFWSYYLSNAWRKVSFRTTLESLQFEISDYIVMNVPLFSGNQVTGIVDKIGFNTLNHEFDVEALMISRGTNGNDDGPTEDPNFWKEDKRPDPIDDPIDNSDNKFIRVINPNGGEEVERGKDYIVTWETINLNNEVKIDLYWNGTFQSTIVQRTPNTGTYRWSVPATQSTGTQYKIKLTITNYTDLSDSDFTIFERGDGDDGTDIPDGGEADQEFGYFILEEYTYDPDVSFEDLHDRLNASRIETVFTVPDSVMFYAEVPNAKTSLSVNPDLFKDKSQLVHMPILTETTGAGFTTVNPYGVLAGTPYKSIGSLLARFVPNTDAWDEPIYWDRVTNRYWKNLWLSPLTENADNYRIPVLYKPNDFKIDLMYFHVDIDWDTWDLPLTVTWSEAIFPGRAKNVDWPDFTGDGNPDNVDYEEHDWEDGDNFLPEIFFGFMERPKGIEGQGASAKFKGRSIRDDIKSASDHGFTFRTNTSTGAILTGSQSETTTAPETGDVEFKKLSRIGVFIKDTSVIDTSLIIKFNMCITSTSGDDLKIRYSTTRPETGADILSATIFADPFNPVAVSEGGPQKQEVDLFSVKPSSGPMYIWFLFEGDDEDTFDTEYNAVYDFEIEIDGSTVDLDEDNDPDPPIIPSKPKPYDREIANIINTTQPGVTFEPYSVIEIEDPHDPLYHLDDSVVATLWARVDNLPAQYALVMGGTSLAYLQKGVAYNLNYGDRKAAIKTGIDHEMQVGTKLGTVQRQFYLDHGRGFIVTDPLPNETGYVMINIDPNPSEEGPIKELDDVVPFLSNVAVYVTNATLRTLTHGDIIVLDSFTDYRHPTDSLGEPRVYYGRLVISFGDTLLPPNRYVVVDGPQSLVNNREVYWCKSIGYDATGNALQVNLDDNLSKNLPIEAGTPFVPTYIRNVDELGAVTIPYQEKGYSDGIKVGIGFLSVDDSNTNSSTILLEPHTTETRNKTLSITTPSKISNDGYLALSGDLVTGSGIKYRTNSSKETLKSKNILLSVKGSNGTVPVRRSPADAYTDVVSFTASELLNAKNLYVVSTLLDSDIKYIYMDTDDLTSNENLKLTIISRDLGINKVVDLVFTGEDEVIVPSDPANAFQLSDYIELATDPGVTSNDNSTVINGQPWLATAQKHQTGTQTYVDSTASYYWRRVYYESSNEITYMLQRYNGGWESVVSATLSDGGYVPWTPNEAPTSFYDDLFYFSQNGFVKPDWVK